MSLRRNTLTVAKEKSTSPKFCELCDSSNPRLHIDTSNVCKKSADEKTSCALCSELFDLERAIEKARQEFRGLLDKHEKVLRKLNAHHDPVQRLPIELISRIFTFCDPAIKPAHADPSESFSVLDSYSPYSYNASDADLKFKEDAPLVLGMVCHRWREVACSTSQLWKEVPVRFDCNNINTQAAVVTDWIARSGQLPLTIGAFFSPRKYKSQAFKLDYRKTLSLAKLDSLKPLFEVLSRCSDRWDTLQLFVPPELIPRFFMTQIPYCDQKGCDPEYEVSDWDLYDLESPETAKRFRSLLIVVDPKFGTGHWQSRFGIPVPPKPEHVELHNLRLTGLWVEWPDTKYVVVDALTDWEVFHILEQSPNLEDLVIGGHPPSDKDRDRHRWPAVPLVYKSLKFLTISGDSKLITQITMPNLETLEVRLPGGRGQDIRPPDALAGFLARSKPPLGSLTIRGTCPFDPLVQLLLPLEKLGHLEFYDSAAVNDRFLEMLSSKTFVDTAKNGSARPFLPLVCHFNYHGTRGFKWSSVPGLFPEAYNPHVNPRKLITLELYLNDVTSQKPKKGLAKSSHRKASNLIPKAVAEQLRKIDEDEIGNVYIHLKGQGGAPNVDLLEMSLPKVVEM